MARKRHPRKWKRVDGYQPGVGFCVIVWLAFIMAVISIMRDR